MRWDGGRGAVVVNADLSAFGGTVETDPTGVDVRDGKADEGGGAGDADCNGKAEVGVARKAEAVEAAGCAVDAAKKEGCLCAVLLANMPKPLPLLAKADCGVDVLLACCSNADNMDEPQSLVCHRSPRFARRRYDRAATRGEDGRRNIQTPLYHQRQMRHGCICVCSGRVAGTVSATASGSSHLSRVECVDTTR